MQRWTALLFVGLVAIAVALVVRGGDAPAGAVSAESQSSVSTAVPGQPDVLVVAPTALPAPALDIDLDAGTLEPLAGMGGENADAGATLPDGSPAPAVPKDAPAEVGFGVIMVTYAGAQGAPRDARTRDAALALATKLTKDAKEDFAAAAKQGDVGLTDAGKMQRNVLEPAPEYTLFSLDVGEVGGPVDSPRGFYVFKRID